ncbi:hypothetical protein DL98DRAFT_635069 [Cadophora sp. DSE1049]|nr:hypothetical protein DL98DRAFT_635069 [Cadophora sp. DSE1049]
MAGPYGKLARRIGKKPIMFMNLISYTLAGAYFAVVCYYHEIFDVRCIYLTPLFDIFGGGYVVFSSFTYTYISESIDQERFGFLYKLSAGEMCLLGFICLGATIPFCCLLPNTRRKHKQNSQDSNCSTKSPQSSETSSLLSTAPPFAPLPMDIEDGPMFWTIMTTLRTKARNSISTCREVLASSSLSRTTMFTFFLLTCGANIRVVFVQWPSVTYGWILAEVHAIISYEAVISSILFLTLPTISHKILKPRLGGSVSEVDLFVTKFSAVAHVVGILCIGLAPTKASYIVGVTVWRLGHGLMDALRSYVTGLLDNKEDVEQLYLGIGMVETLGAMIATASWSGLFAKVLGKG